MAETYCGKSCLDCEYKETLECGGCMNDVPMWVDDACEIRKCCRSKGHENCETCSFHGTCGTLKCRNRVPENIQRSRDLEKARQERLARKVPLLAKWLWIMFWLGIGGILTVALTSDVVHNALPSLYLPALVLDAAVSLGIVFCLYRLQSEDERYRRAAIFALLGIAATLVTGFLSVWKEETPVWSLLYSVPIMILEIVGVRCKYLAHSSIVADVDAGLSRHWEGLWKWYAISLALLFGSLFLMLLFPVLGAVVMIAALIATCVVGISEHVYLYRMAKLFREYTEISR